MSLQWAVTEQGACNDRRLCSWVKAAQDFFGSNGGTKVTIDEFKALTDKDKSDLARARGGWIGGAR